MAVEDGGVLRSYGREPADIGITLKGESGVQFNIEGDYVARRGGDLGTNQPSCDCRGEVAEAGLARTGRQGLDLASARATISIICISVITAFIREDDNSVPTNRRAITVTVFR